MLIFFVYKKVQRSYGETKLENKNKLNFPYNKNILMI